MSELIAQVSGLLPALLEQTGVAVTRWLRLFTKNTALC